MIGLTSARQGPCGRKALRRSYEDCGRRIRCETASHRVSHTAFVPARMTLRAYAIHRMARNYFDPEAPRSVARRIGRKTCFALKDPDRLRTYHRLRSSGAVCLAAGASSDWGGATYSPSVANEITRGQGPAVFLQITLMTLLMSSAVSLVLLTVPRTPGASGTSGEKVA